MGTDWPYTDLKNDECIWNSKYFYDILEVGDQLTLTGELYYFWAAVADEYNRETADLGYPLMPNNYAWDDWILSLVTNYTCTVKGFFNETYGKIP